MRSRIRQSLTLVIVWAKYIPYNVVFTYLFPHLIFLKASCVSHSHVFKLSARGGSTTIIGRATYWSNRSMTKMNDGLLQSNGIHCVNDVIGQRSFGQKADSNIDTPFINMIYLYMVSLNIRRSYRLNILAEINQFIKCSELEEVLLSHKKKVSFSCLWYLRRLRLLFRYTMYGHSWFDRWILKNIMWVLQDPIPHCHSALSHKL